MAACVVIDQQSVFAVADDFGQTADAAGDHRHGGRHGEQGAGAQAFAVGDVDQDRGVAEVSSSRCEIIFRPMWASSAAILFRGRSTCVPCETSSTGTPS